MQNFIPTTYRSREKISSAEWNKQSRDINADLTEVYRSTINSRADSKVAMDMSLMIEKSMELENRLIDIDLNYENIQYLINDDRIIYPTSLRTNRRVNLDLRTSTYTLNVIDVDRQFIEYNPDTFKWYPKANVRISRRIQSPYNKAYDNSYVIDQILTQGYPYIVKVPDSQKPVIELILDIPGSPDLRTNFVYIQPFPISFGTAIKSFTLQTATGIDVETQLIDRSFIDWTMYNEVERSRPLVFPIKRTQFARIKLELQGLNYIPAENASHIGLSRIQLDDYIFASESVIGFRVNMNGNRFINELEMIVPQFAPLTQDIKFYVYDNIIDFNAMNNKYVAFNKSNIKIDNDTAYVLVKLFKSELETTPILKGIRYKLVG